MKKLYSLISLISVLNCSNFDYTPGGIAVDKNGYHPRMDIIDLKYDAVESCLREKEIPLLNKKEDALVYIITDDNVIRPCPDPAYDFCWGYYCLEPLSVGCDDVGTVVVPENLRRLGHEFVHHLRKNGEHDSLVSICGTRLDDNINKTYLDQ